ncbi:MAG TPA: hypothetical protein PK014_03375 [Thermoanaerobaculia bacterium]|nr:hypothetical protein [Thermoanaerobaculia bacterium]HXK67563.1 hypothetical protein [Thermoanaerobaculia bacterium]
MKHLFLRDKHFGCVPLTGDIFITEGDVERDLAFARRLGHDPSRARTLSGSIVHEIAHRLIQHRVGFFQEHDLPVWLREGLCDYIARDSILPAREALEGILGRRSIPSSLTHGYLRRACATYLLRKEGRSIDELLDSPPLYDKIRNRVVALMESDPEGFLSWVGENESIQTY